MAFQGIVDLSQVELNSLVGHRLKDDLDDEGVVFHLRNGEPLVKISPCDAHWTPGNPESGRRVRVWAPRVEQAAWVWQATTNGTPLIRWLPFQQSLNGRGKDGLSATSLLCVTAMQTKSKSTGVLSCLCSSPAPQYEKGDILLQHGDTSMKYRTRAVTTPDALNSIVNLPNSDVHELHAPLDVFVAFCEGTIPSSLLLCANEALDAFAGQHEIAKPGSEASILFARDVQQRDCIRRDFIDPDLCLAGKHWQSADVEVDGKGQVHWLSWVHHINATQHSALLSVLAGLVRLSLPQLEVVSGYRLRSRHIQVVVQAYEDVVDGNGPLNKVAEWHTDGYPREHIIATSVCCVRKDPALHGGAVDFAYANAWEAGPDALKTVLPQHGGVLTFNSAMIHHRVWPLGGAGRHRIVALHLVDPDFCQTPRAMDLPRQLLAQGRLEMMRLFRALSLPNPCKALIVHFCVDGHRAPDLVNLRDLARVRNCVHICMLNRNNVLRGYCAAVVARDRLHVEDGVWSRICRMIGRS